MYIKKMKIFNFRKFSSENNLVQFAKADKLKTDEKNNFLAGTTLIVGKNNSGKSSVIKALEKLLGYSAFNEMDFNFSYISQILKDYNKGDFLKCPELKFILTICIEDEEDKLTNLNGFVKLGTGFPIDIDIMIKYAILENEIFIERSREILEKYKEENPELIFDKYIDMIRTSKFQINYYGENDEEVIGFKLNNLIELKAIKANLLMKDSSLTNMFSQIVRYRYDNLLQTKKAELESKMTTMNTMITDKIDEEHTRPINESVKQIHPEEYLKIKLSSNITFEALMKTLIKYEYLENNERIPENQFGLGYSNLMMIIAELVDYIERFEDKSFSSMVNIISIEEPETYMHPQMEELFISHIDQALNTLLSEKGKQVTIQLVISTHSSHILNSKILQNNSFNNINYMSILNNNVYSIPLQDELISKDFSENEKIKNMNFLKKHIKFKVSEIFFSDAVIFVEGVTEEVILKYYIEKDDELSKRYISVFNIDGAHALVYKKLIETLGLPTVIITDVDIKRNKEEIDAKSQMVDITGKETTNETIKNFSGCSLISSLPTSITLKNVFVSYQSKIGEYYPSSFEESLILSNHDNKILNLSIQETIKITYNTIYQDDYDNIKNSSYMLQAAINAKKTRFANTLLFNLINADEGDIIPKLPDYITNSVEFIRSKLGESK